MLMDTGMNEGKESVYYSLQFSVQLQLQLQVSARYCPSRLGGHSAVQTGTPASRTSFAGHGAPTWLSERGHVWLALLQFGPI